MADILHRLSLTAAPKRVHQVVATKEGIEAWWTGSPVGGHATVGGKLLIYFGGDEPAAVMEVVEDGPEHVAWRCVEGPEQWRETRITFTITARPDGGTTLLFSHSGWREQTEFMSGCSSNWGAYLAGLKSGVEGQGFRPYPAGELSRWD